MNYYKNLTSTSETDKFILMFTGMILGMSLGISYSNTVRFGRKLSYINRFKRLIQSSYENKKTFYFDGEIGSKSVEDFKYFMFKILPSDEIDIVIQTNGGSFACAQMISNIISEHKGVSNALVLNNAFSAGALIALSCKNLYMHKNAHLSPVDVIHSSFFDAVQLSSVKSVLGNKNKDKIDDKTFLLSDQAIKCHNILDGIFDKIVRSKYSEDVANKIKEELFDGEKYVHSTSFSVEKLKEIGLNVNTMTSDMVYKCQLVNKFVERLYY